MAGGNKGGAGKRHIDSSKLPPRDNWNEEDAYFAGEFDNEDPTDPESSDDDREEEALPEEPPSLGSKDSDGYNPKE
ncbi:hypothetical protein U9M48_001783 [Paspalum notatum var. saurae]|uniref:Uncharacterized protein n=1 Tax=Paspalum notatum var. saurae TaxID=547442 RepID=A0AAQ3PP69_PASNO